MTENKPNGETILKVEQLGVPVMLEVLIEAVRELSENQETILEQQNEILEKLDNLEKPVGNGYEDE